MRLPFRWFSNALAFYLALYLLDSLVAPRFSVGAVWIAVILGVLLGLLNSLVRPLYGIRRKPYQAIAVAALTVVVNALIIQVMMWIGAPLSASNLGWVLVAAIFLSVLAGLINHIVGFKPPKERDVITRDLRTSRPPGEGGTLARTRADREAAARARAEREGAERSRGGQGAAGRREKT